MAIIKGSEQRNAADATTMHPVVVPQTEPTVKQEPAEFKEPESTTVPVAVAIDGDTIPLLFKVDGLGTDNTAYKKISPHYTPAEALYVQIEVPQEYFVELEEGESPVLNARGLQYLYTQLLTISRNADTDTMKESN